MTAGLTRAELAYLDSQTLGRLATVDGRGLPHVAPVGFSYNATTGTIDIGGYNMAGTAKFGHVRRAGEQDDERVGIVHSHLLE